MGTNYRRKGAVVHRLGPVNQMRVGRSVVPEGRSAVSSAYRFLTKCRVVAGGPVPGLAQRYLACCREGEGEGDAQASFRVRRSRRRLDRGQIAGRYDTAMRWITELDAWAEEQLSDGQEVRISLPSVDRQQQSTNGRPALGRILMPLVTRRRGPWPLYGYQRVGVRRLVTSERCLLADDMGLGKTLQVVVAIARLLENGESRRFLVVAPTAVLESWRQEFLRWAPMICVRVAGGKQTRKVFRQCWNAAHVVLTNYEQMRQPPPEVKKWVPGVVVLDEAHRIKNWKAQVAKGMRSVGATRIWALTGTPVEKGKIDLVGLMRFLDPRRFGQWDRDSPSWLLRAKARPYVLRREKVDVLAELPAVTHRFEQVCLTGAQERRYRQVLAESASDEDILASYTKLQTICDYDPITATSAKLDRAMEILWDVCVSRREKAIVFSYLLRPLELLRKRIHGTRMPFVGVYQGSLNGRQRLLMLERYRELRSGVLLASMRAAGEGLTLTDANNVLLINRWWNPSANTQAIGRVHRIGQRLPVTVYYFVARRTIDERLTKMLADKEMVFDEVIARLAVAREVGQNEY